ncbi:hypothetical protein IWQ56_005743, partial [Coemansia nantahalensis]
MSDAVVEQLDRLVRGTLEGRPNNELTQGLRRYMIGLRMQQAEARKLEPQIDDLENKVETVEANIRSI